MATDPPITTAPSEQDAAAILLRWYLDAGVDVGIGEYPLDRYALTTEARERAQRDGERNRAAAPPAPRGGGSESRGRSTGFAGHPSTGHTPMDRSPGVGEDDDSPASQVETLRAAAHMASEATSLEALRATLDSFHACALRRTATNTVFADGKPDFGVMVIGEAPGADEDRLGLPFVGVSGKLLDAMLASIGLDRRLTYITNVVPWRPPGNRKPTGDEVALCLPFLERHVELVRPRVILAVGGLAAQSLLARTEGITRLRGQWKDYATPGLSRPVPVLATFHPAYLLRTPAQKRLAWKDMRTLRARLDSFEAPNHTSPLAHQTTPTDSSGR
ncbi:uracil-DNA glycosylase [Rhodospirillum sp. A1_3_36]|uniref:uracil-DNA glycosylase n=1 Tax=Rhodospirillum sp. A1_3_36 TaxID=3391666 RepID=UPI0039A75707